MVSEKELVLISHLRQDARKNLTKISRDTGMPVSTIFDKMKELKGSIVRRHTTLLDFSKLGYDVRVNLAIKVPREKRDELKEYLLREPKVNSISRINNGYDFLIEAIFRNMKEANDFTEGLERFGVKSVEEYFVLEDLKREAFMSDPQTAKIFL